MHLYIIQLITKSVRTEAAKSNKYQVIYDYFFAIQMVATFKGGHSHLHELLFFCLSVESRSLCTVGMGKLPIKQGQSDVLPWMNESEQKSWIREEGG